MNAREQGFVLLTSHLGDPERKPLTTAQLRMLTTRMQTAKQWDLQRSVQQRDLIAVGYSRQEAERILHLLSQQDVLEDYIRRGKRSGCIPITRISPEYPQWLRRRMGSDCPAVLWAKGDITLLSSAAVALVGSRELRNGNRRFAQQVGTAAAQQGFTLVSGNARGADQTAQQACHEAGGQVISVVADRLDAHTSQPRILYLSEDGFDLEFSPVRALSRNRIIHCLAEKTFVAQCTLERGGTWNGTLENLRHSWSGVYCFSDGSDAAQQLVQRGATAVQINDLQDLEALKSSCLNFLENGAMAHPE